VTGHAVEVESAAQMEELLLNPFAIDKSKVQTCLSSVGWNTFCATLAAIPRTPAERRVLDGHLEMCEALEGCLAELRIEFP
jgi:hypothetical protein